MSQANSGPYVYRGPGFNLLVPQLDTGGWGTRRMADDRGRSAVSVVRGERREPAPRLRGPKEFFLQSQQLGGGFTTPTPRFSTFPLQVRRRTQHERTQARSEPGGHTRAFPLPFFSLFMHTHFFTVRMPHVLALLPLALAIRQASSAPILNDSGTIVHVQYGCA